MRCKNGHHLMVNRLVLMVMMYGLALLSRLLLVVVVVVVVDRAVLHYHCIPEHSIILVRVGANFLITSALLCW